VTFGLGKTLRPIFRTNSPDSSASRIQHRFFSPGLSKQQRTALEQWRIEKLCAGLVRLPGRAVADARTVRSYGPVGS